MARFRHTTIDHADGTVEQVDIPYTPEEEAARDADEAAVLAEIPNLAWARIKAERDRRKDGGVLVSGKWFHTDPDSRIQQLGLVLMGAGVPAVQWKTMDGSFMPMSQALASGIFQAVAALDMALFVNAETHKAAMAASGNPAAYNFSAGWPEAYGG